MQPPEPQTIVSDIDLSTAKRPLVLVGASVRAAAQSANRAGFDVLGLDCFGDVDTREACQWFATLEQVDALDVEEFARVFARRSSPTSILAVPLMVVGGNQDAAVGQAANVEPSFGDSTFGESAFGGAGSEAGLSVFERVLRRLAGHTRRVGVDGAAERQLQDPAVLSRIAIRSRSNFPPYRATNVGPRPADLPGRWLAKSVGSSGGLGVCWADDGQPHRESETPAPETLCEGQIRQLWRPGRSYGVSFLSDGDEVMMLGVCRSLFTAQGDQRFLYAGSYGPLRLPELVQKQLHAVGQQVVDQVGAEGLFNADVLVDEDHKVCLLEVNGRWSASMECVERSLAGATKMQSENLSLIGLAMTSAEGKPLRVNQRRVNSMLSDAPRYLKKVVYARSSGVVNGSVFDKIESRTPAGFSQVDICDRPQHGENVNAGEPLCSVVCCFDGRQTLEWRKTKRLFASLQKAVV